MGTPREPRAVPRIKGWPPLSRSHSAENFIFVESTRSRPLPYLFLAARLEAPANRLTGQRGAELNGSLGSRVQAKYFRVMRSTTAPVCWSDRCA